MKITIITALLLFFVSDIFSQKIKESKVPKAVIDSFNKNFSGSKVKEWEKEKGNYEAEFEINKIENSATFSADGKLIESETVVDISTVPKEVKEYITKNYAGHKITEVSKITDAKGKVSYEAEMKKGKKEIDLVFDEAGTFLKKEVDNHDDNDGELNNDAASGAGD